MIIIRKLLSSNILVLIVIIMLFIPLKGFAEEDLNITRWLVNSEIMENGDLAIVEDITFDFNTVYNGVFRDIILEGTKGIENMEIVEMIEGKEIKYEQVTQGEKGDNKVFVLENIDNTVVAKIFSPSKDEQKTFRLKYTIKDVAINYNDTGELYYKFLGANNTTPIDYFSVNIKLPKNRNNKVKIFAHGPLNGKINFKNENLIHLEVENIPSNTFVEGRILFPKNFIPHSTNIVDANAYNNIIEEEQNYLAEIETKKLKKEKRKTAFNYISPMSGSIGVIFIVLLMIKFKRQTNIYESIECDVIPEECTPAIASYLVSSSISSDTIIATLLDLSRKGYLKIENDEKSEKDISNLKLTRIKDVDNQLLNHEKYFMYWLFKEIGNTYVVTTKDIEKYAENHDDEFLSSYIEWKNKVKEDAIERGYFDKSKKQYGILLTILSPILLTISIFSIVSDSLWGIFPLIVSIASLIYGITLFNRKSDYGYIECKKWKNFVKEMENTSESIDLNGLALPIDISLIYALGLGIDKSIINLYEPHVKEHYVPNHWMYWYFYTNSGNTNVFEKSIDKAFDSTSSLGSGGGFSGGGGGGAGGGGAGGF